MQFVWWLTGVLATLGGIKFVWMVFKKLTSKENLEAVLDRAEDGMNNTADRIGNYFKKKKAEKDNRPIVTIR